MENPRFNPPHRPSLDLPEIYIHGSNPSDRFRSTSRSNGFSSRFSPDRSSNAMAIPNAREPGPPPPLPPPKFPELDTAGDSGAPDIAWQWSNSREESSWGRPSSINPGSSLYGSFASRGKSIVEERSEMDRRSSSASTIKSISGVGARRDAFPRIDEGYASLSGTSVGSSLSRFEESLPSRSAFKSSMHDTYQNDDQAYTKSLLQKFGSRKGIDNAAPPRGYPRSPFSSSLNDTSPTSRIAHEHRQQPLPLSMPAFSGKIGSVESPLARWAGGGLSAISPHSHYSNSHSGYRSPERDDTEKSPRPYIRRSPSGSLTNSDDRSVRGSHEPTSAEVDPEFPLEETSGLRRLRIDDNFSRSDGSSPIFSAGLKRRASSPPSDDTPPSLHTVGSASDLFRRRESAARASPAVGYHSTHDSVSSTASGPRANSYTSNLSLAASSVTTMSSYGRLSPGGLSPGGLSPRSTDGNDSPYITTASLTASPRGSASSPRQRNFSEGRTLMTAGKTPETIAHHSKHFSPSKLHGVYICECCPKKPKKFETEEELSAHEMEKQYECAYCKSRFKNKNEAERHQNSLHRRRHSWSCAVLSGYSAAFHNSSTRPSESDTCGYCGEEFPRTGAGPKGIEGKVASDRDLELRIQHLVDVHKFGECNHTKKFFRADHFRQHLKHSHAGTSGKWTNMLENACMKDEPIPEPRAGRIAEESEI